MSRLTNPVPIFLDVRGELLDAGKIYVGVAGQDPETSPVSVYWDAERTQVAAQPLRTLGGIIVNGESPAFVYFEEEDFSLRILDVNDIEVISISSSAEEVEAGASYQPLNSQLTAIAALTTTAFGRGLLTLLNQAALQALVGNASGLPLTGGTVSGNITRSGAGAHLYHTDSAFVSGRVFSTDEGDADPTSTAGDIWLKLA